MGNVWSATGSYPLRPRLSTAPGSGSSRTSSVTSANRSSFIGKNHSASEIDCRIVCPIPRHIHSNPNHSGSKFTKNHLVNLILRRQRRDHRKPLFRIHVCRPSPEVGQKDRHVKRNVTGASSGTAFMTVPHYSVYSSSKRALLGFSLTARAELEKDSIVVSEIYPFITATNFGKNRMGNPGGGGPSANYADGDRPEFVASLVLQAIEEGQAQYFANDRLRKMAGGAA